MDKILDLTKKNSEKLEIFMESLYIFSNLI